MVRFHCVAGHILHISSLACRDESDLTWIVKTTSQRCACRWIFTISRRFWVVWSCILQDSFLERLMCASSTSRAFFHQGAHLSLGGRLSMPFVHGQQWMLRKDFFTTISMRYAQLFGMDLEAVLFSCHDLSFEWSAESGMYCTFSFSFDSNGNDNFQLTFALVAWLCEVT